MHLVYNSVVSCHILNKMIQQEDLKVKILVMHSSFLNSHADSGRHRLLVWLNYVN